MPSLGVLRSNAIEVRKDEHNLYLIIYCDVCEWAYNGRNVISPSRLYHLFPTYVLLKSIKYSQVFIFHWKTKCNDMVWCHHIYTSPILGLTGRLAFPLSASSEMRPQRVNKHQALWRPTIVAFNTINQIARKVPRSRQMVAAGAPRVPGPAVHSSRGSCWRVVRHQHAKVPP